MKTRLAVAGAMLIAASVMLAVLVTLRVIDARVRDAALDSETAQMQLTARIVSGRLLTRQLALRQIANAFDPRLLADTPALLEWLRQHRGLLTLFDSIFVVSPQGRVVAYLDTHGPKATDIDVSDRPYYRQTLTEHVPQISEPTTGRVTGAANIFFTMPIAAPEHGRLDAVIGGGLLLSGRELVADVVDGESDSHIGRVTAIFDARGRLVAHPNVKALMQPAESDPRLAPTVKAWRGSGAGIEPSVSARQADGYFLTLAGVPLAEWNIVTSTPESVLLGSVTQARRRALWLAVALAGIGGMALWGTTLWLLKPFDRMKRRAAAMELLEEEAAVPEPWPRGRGEVGELARVLEAVERRAREGARDRAKLVQQMRSVLAQASVGILFTVDRKMVLVSQALCRMLGYAEDELIGQPARLLYPSDEAYAAVGPQVAAAFTRREQFDTELQFVRRDGSLVWVRLMGRPVEHANAALGTIWIIDDVGEMRHRREQLAWASSHDWLTGLTNRQAFEQALDQLVHDDRRAKSQRPFCVLALDLDRFKAVNDASGHAAGDALLREVSALIANRLRRGDIVARIGGDEFAAVLLDCDLATATGVAQSICDQISAYRLAWGGERHGVGISIGVAESDAALNSVAAMMAAADAACYQAKKAGRGQVRAAPRDPPTPP
ncbi:MAG TPA: diguanylate cyclase [Burkholderiaceae bacterium]|nr:diguanylate cyclase [Burkholderiaceae bacterium]